MEREPLERPRWNDEPRLPTEEPAAAELVPGQARRIIEDGIAVASRAGQDVDDWVARHIALQLRDEDGSAFDVLARSGEIDRELLPELMRAYIQLPPQRSWIQSLHDYAEHREDRGPVDGWEIQAVARDRFHTAWWDRDKQRGERFQEGRQLDREIRLAQDARQVIGDELALRLLVRIAANPHGAVARFAADGRVTDELSQELQERYQSGTNQERRWLNELGTWILARGEQSPVPWWRSPASSEPPVME